MNKPILMTEEDWRYSQFSIARFYGSIKINGIDYIIVNKEGKDLFECSIEAEKAGRTKAIETGEPADLIDRRYQPIYRKVGRDTFIKWVKDGLELKQMKAKVKETKGSKQ